MNTQGRGSGLAASCLVLVALAGYAQAEGQSSNQSAEVTLKGSMVCNAACIPNPKVSRAS